MNRERAARPTFRLPALRHHQKKPLSPTARRAGWIGCNFALNRIPADARIAVVTEKEIIPETEVREKFKRIKPLKEISVTQRGWTLDVLNAIRRLGKTAFTTADAYAFTRELEKLHPDFTKAEG
jgi:type II restriction enzyme